MKMLWATFLLLSLTGCASDGYDTVTARIPSELGNRLAADSVMQLQTLYPPGQTQFNIDQPISQADVFGTALVSAMRKNGYAVQEANPQQPARTSGSLNVRYTVDKPETSLYTGLYRVRLKVGKSVLTRAYNANNTSASPAGAWAVME